MDADLLQAMLGRAAPEGETAAKIARRLAPLVQQVRALDAAALMGTAPDHPGEAEPTGDPWVCLAPETDHVPDGPLRGVTVAVKDICDVAGLPTRAGSRLLAGAPAAARDAAAVARLRDAGARILGKTATHEFAYGCTTPGARNPRDPSRSPGGSSGGSAAAVAAGLADIALGTDTAGSVRMPAACCGVVGFKPTNGLIPTEGIIPLAPSLDHVGIFARTLAYCTRAMQVLADLQPAPEVKRPRIGVPWNWVNDGPSDPDAIAGLRRAIVYLIRLGAEVVDLPLPPLKLYQLASTVITLAEASAYHAPYLAQDPAYSPDVGARIELGQYILAQDYILAQRLKGALTRETLAAMADLDAIITPTMPVAAPLIGQRHYEFPGGKTEPVPEAMMRFTAPFNLTGQPAISLHCCLNQEGLPIGVQLAGPPGADGALLQLAGILEAALADSGPKEG